MADLIASYAFEEGLDLEEFFAEATTLPAVLERLLHRSKAIEASMKQYDPRDYGLYELLRLLAGGTLT